MTIVPKLGVLSSQRDMHGMTQFTKFRERYA